MRSRDERVVRVFGEEWARFPQSALSQADTHFWKGRIVIFLTGALKYQATDITAFDPATDKLTFTALTNAPAGGDTYVVV